MRDQDRKRPTTEELSGTTPGVCHLRNCECSECVPVSIAALRALVRQWREEAAAEQRVSFCADQLERLITGAE